MVFCLSVLQSFKARRTVLLDCPLEYKKGESQTNIEISKDTDFSRFQELEEAQVKAMVDKIIVFKPDLVITEKGVSGRVFRTMCYYGFFERTDYVQN